MVILKERVDAPPPFFFFFEMYWISDTVLNALEYIILHKYYHFEQVSCNLCFIHGKVEGLEYLGVFITLTLIASRDLGSAPDLWDSLQYTVVFSVRISVSF